MNAQQELNKPTLVVFDLDDTLYDYAPSNRAATDALISLASHETGRSAREIATELDAARLRVKGRTEGTAASHSRLLYIHEMLTQLGFGARPQIALNLENEFWRVYISSMNLASGSSELLTTLRYHSIPIALVTDLTLQIQLRKLVFLGLEGAFDILVASEEAGGEKPELTAFKLLAERATQDELRNVWFIGDKKYDAPVMELTDSGVISTGLGWVRGNSANPQKHIRGWNVLSEVEEALVQVIERD